MLEIIDLVKNYESNKGVCVKALKGLSLSLPDKGLIFIIGKSGSGKSTLLNLLGGLDRPTSGEMIIDGRSSATFSDNDFDSYRNKYVGFVFQEYNLIDNYTVGLNVALALELQGKKCSRNEVDDVLRKMELVDEEKRTLYDRHINELSGGQKQRVAIARALIKEPRIILADEPTGALDSETGAALYELLRSLAQDKLVLVVSHDIECAKRYADRIIELKDGQIIGDSKTSESSVTGDLKVNENTEQQTPGKLPLKRTLIMGLTGLRHKTFRLVISVILAVVSLSIFGFSMVSSTTDVLTTELKTAYSIGQKTVVLQGNSKVKSSTKYKKGGSSQREDVYSKHLTKEQLDELYKHTSAMKIVYFSNAPRSSDIFYGLGLPISVQYNPYNYLAMHGFQRVIELDPATGADDACLKPDPRLTKECRLPNDFNEIAITDYWADMFIRFGYPVRNESGEGSTAYKISGPDDLIGKTIDGLAICGIFATEEDKEILKQYDADQFNGREYISDNYLANLLDGEHTMNYAFVKQGYEAHKVYETTGEELSMGSYNVLYKLSGNVSQDKALIKNLTYTFEREWDELHYFTHADYYISAAVRTRSSGFTEATDFFRNEIFIRVSIIVSVVFALFSTLLFMSFLNVSLDYRKRELGILRALGARRLDVLKIVLTESGLIAIIDFVISLVIVIIISCVLNGVFHIAIFNVGVIPVLSMLLLCFGVAVLATALPIVHLTKKKPIDIINSK